ncbi:MULTISPECIES: hypothetical protein [unclassified Pseudonocardia]|uniref:hypothetical protein n=1 Tax=unclassified Pseudonocardia TaxID=2619320 RepID=UPI0011154707|nr:MULTISPECIES: hypothetical protein [unclassified Pseudonocardia]
MADAVCGDGLRAGAARVAGGGDGIGCGEVGRHEPEQGVDAAQRDYESVVEIPTARLAAYLEQRTGLAPEAADATARALVARTVYPEVMSCLLGVRPPLPRRPDPVTLADDVDLDRIRSCAVSLVPAGP